MAFYHNKKDDVHAYDDYSCYITIRNLSDEDFGLDDFGIVDGYGVWPAGQPLNTIEAHSEPTVQLKDPKGTASIHIPLSLDCLLIPQSWVVLKDGWYMRFLLERKLQHSDWISPILRRLGPRIT